MAFNVNEFKSQLVGGGARPNLFQVQITNPITGSADFKVPFMVKAASLPPSSTGSFEVPYMGRKIKYGGDRVFQEWQVTVINDEDFLIRNAMEAWSDSINAHVRNTRALPSTYKSDAQITQYGKDETPIRRYQFQGLFPTEISPIEMSWETNDAIEEFTVTFQYDLWTVDGGNTGNPTT
tara:strand:+ start:112 stop:648 length:537 start_codon:yes stop_codon:yes gene_type:complete